MRTWTYSALAGAARSTYLAAALLVCVLSPRPLQAQDRTVAGFDIFVHIGSESGYDALWEALPERIERIRADLGSQVLLGGEIHVLAELNRFFEARGEPARAPRWAQALAIPARRLILLRTPDPQPLSTLTHELSHLAVHEAVSGEHVPRWFVEGFAMLQAEEWGLGRSWAIMEAALFGQTLRFSELDTRFPPHLLSANLAYAQSFHFVRYLVNEYGMSKAAAWLRAIARGAEWRAAFRSAFGLPFDTVEGAWRGTIKVWYAWIPAAVSLISSWTALALLTIWARRSVRRRRRARLAVMAAAERSLYPPDPDDTLFD